jgi:selenocysteine lyase/cysteine desulfurase
VYTFAVQEKESDTPVDCIRDEIDAAAAFRRDYPAYERTRLLDDLRAREYARLDEQGQIYLDYTGGSLYAESQLQAHLELLRRHVFGNPHSHNPTSQAATDLMEQARGYVLHFFNASPDEYDVIFTANASGALKLVGESYPFGPQGRYLLTYDNHNSVNGIREFARARGAKVRYVPIHQPDLRVDEEELAQHLARAMPDRRESSGRLFAYPAQSNFTGVQHPLAWIEQAQAMGWDVLVDCAAFAPTNRLDLSRWRPDFVSLSFYKIFGYPTGVGCLIARKQAMAKLQRPWFAGGTITIASVQGEGWHYLHSGSAGFEDGTVNYLNLPAVEIGLRHIESIGIEMIHERVHCLTGWLLEKMAALRHSNGSPLVRIYGPTKLERRGGTIAFNLYHRDGAYYDYRLVETQANDAGISLRTGCFCNPGAGEIAHGITQQEIAQCFRRSTPMTFEQFFTYIHNNRGKEISALRVSVGLASNFQDVYRFVAFLRRFLDR